MYHFLLISEDETERPDRPELRVPLPGPRLLLREEVLLPARREGPPLPRHRHLPRLRRRRGVRGLYSEITDATVFTF